MNRPIKIIECPRDAMQGIRTLIPTHEKISYINQLLKAGFDTLDAGSFVSPKAIPQMVDSSDVINALDINNSTSILTIVANIRGAEVAVQNPRIKYLGYPFSLSETFQLRNTNATLEESLIRVSAISKLCQDHKKELVLYLSMGFGNPYGDPWNRETVESWVEKLYPMGIKIFSLSDTIGVSNPENIYYLFSHLIPSYPDIEFGAHIHTTPTTWREKIEAAFEAGCRRFDGAMRGYGGCPMAKDELTGNMATENLLYFFEEKEIDTGIDRREFNKCMSMAALLFDTYTQH